MNAETADTSYLTGSPDLRLEVFPVVLVKYCGLQEGFAQLAPRALFNVVGGEIADLIGSTVTLESLTARGYQIKEANAETLKAETLKGRAA